MTLIIRIKRSGLGKSTIRDIEDRLIEYAMEIQQASGGPKEPLLEDPSVMSQIWLFIYHITSNFCGL